MCFKCNCNLVLDVPDPPENVKCTGVGEETATIVWDPPAFDGGAALKGKGWILCLMVWIYEVLIKLLGLLCVLNSYFTHIYAFSVLLYQVISWRGRRKALADGQSSTLMYTNRPHTRLRG